MRVAPALAQVEHTVVPKVVGLLKPTILLPASALSGLSTAELEMILAHEIAHVRRYDMWVNLLQRLAEVVLFFNLGLWFLSRRIGSLREYCSDELACREMSASHGEARMRYAEALLRVVKLAQPRSAKHNELATLAASGRSPSELRRRLARLFGEPLREPMRLTGGAVIAVIVIALLLTVGPTVQSIGDSLPKANADANQGIVRTRVRSKPSSRKVPSSVPHGNLPDGIYRVRLPESNEVGVEAARSDADGTVVLLQRLADNFGTASMQSVANDNTRYRIYLKSAGPVSEDGGKQRGARNNQFGFTAFRSAGNGPEGNSRHFGGLITLRTLKPGAIFQKEVDITRWFDLSKSDTYRIQAQFELELHDPNEEPDWTQWEEVFRGECLVVVGEAAVAKTWGDPIAGVQSRVEIIKAVGQQGEPPVLHSYIRRQGGGDLILALVSWPDNWLHVDGRKYRHHGQSSAEKPYRSAQDFIAWGNDNHPRLVTLDGKWRSVEDNKPLKLLPGQHTVRYGYDGVYPRADQPKEPDRRRPVVLWSNPVEIAMLEHVEVAISGASNSALVDLDTGKTLSLLARGGPSSVPKYDIYLNRAVIDGQGNTILAGQLQRLTRVEQRFWDDATEKNVAKKLRVLPDKPQRKLQVLAKPGDKFPVTWVVETRQGGRAMVQVKAYRKNLVTRFNREGVEGFLVRYRLMKSAEAGGIISK